MKKLNVIHWDDDPKIKAFLDIDIPKVLINYSITLENPLFYSNPEEFSTAISQGNFDLIILDLKDQTDNDKKGFELLNDIVRDHGNSTPILIYTLYDHYNDEVNNFRSRHNLKIKLLGKKLRREAIFHETLNACLIELLNLEPKLLDFTPNNDINTKHSIYKIGLTIISGLVGEYLKISGKNKLTTKIKNVRAITPGYSGAYILLIEFETYSKLFKITNNYEQIKKEYVNLYEFSQQLKSSIKVDFEKIEPEKLYFNGWYAIIYELINPSTDLFSWLSEINNINKNQEIISVLETIFSDDGLLSLNKICSETKVSLSENILSDIDPSRVAYIKNTVKELNTILTSVNFDTSYNKDNVFDNLLTTHTFGCISDSELGEPKSIQYLSHNDLHANNILLEKRNYPKIIDPGNISKKHWSSDICRLLVDLIIRGLDINSIEYFKLETIEKWHPMIFSLIKDDISIDIIQDDLNTGFLLAINWLRGNAKNIYLNIYVEWEFQLGLAVEFLKASYKSISLPPGKRTLSLIQACEMIKIAEMNLKSKIEENKLLKK